MLGRGKMGQQRKKKKIERLEKKKGFFNILKKVLNDLAIF